LLIKDELVKQGKLVAGRCLACEQNIGRTVGMNLLGQINVKETLRSSAMNIKRKIWTFLISTSLLGSGSVFARQSSGQEGSTPADNTKVNQRDRNLNEPTADQQKNSLSDRDTTQQIRQAITKDKSLSSYAHNVKVITQNGQVTLKGPVRSDEEKRAIEAKATEIVGENKVTSELDIKPKQ
jgi:osmotically-inducible protein OsmY